MNDIKGLVEISEDAWTEINRAQAVTIVAERASYRLVQVGGDRAPIQIETRYQGAWIEGSTSRWLPQDRADAIETLEAWQAEYDATIVPMQTEAGAVAPDPTFSRGDRVTIDGWGIGTVREQVGIFVVIDLDGSTSVQAHATDPFLHCVAPVAPIDAPTVLAAQAQALIRTCDTLADLTSMARRILVDQEFGPIDWAGMAVLDVCEALEARKRTIEAA